MRDGKGTAFAIIGGVILGGALLGLVWASCSDAGKRDRAGQRADSVLATDTLFVIDTLRQDSAVAQLDSALAAQERATRFWRDSARVAKRYADSVIRHAKVFDTQLGLRDGMTPHDSIVILTKSRDMWRGAALDYSQNVAPALLQQIQSDSIWKLTAIAKADTLTAQRDYARARVNVVTREFREYREATKPGVKVLGLRLPEWAKCIPVAAATTAIGAAAVEDNRPLGATIGGGSGLAGCLLS